MAVQSALDSVDPPMMHPTRLGRPLGAATLALGLTLLAVSAIAGGSPSASFESIPLLLGGNPEGTAEALSLDGSLVAGENDSAGSQLYPFGSGREAWVFRPDEGVTALGDLPGVPYGIYKTFSSLISRDGSTVAGLSFRQEIYTLPWYWRVNGSGLRPLGLPTGAVRAVATALSSDGRRITGWAEGSQGRFPFLWMHGSGTQPLIPPAIPISDGTASAMSPDGATLVGSIRTGNVLRGFRWRGGAVELLPAPGEALAVDVSADGNRVAGIVSVNGQPQAAWWDGSQQPLLLGALPGDIKSQAVAISDDGDRLLGISEAASNAQQLFLWTAESGIVPLGSIPDGFRYEVRGTAPDLSNAAGVVRLLGQEQPFTGFVWDRVRGLRDVKTVLRSEWGLAAQTADYEQLSVNGITADGRTLVGEAGISPVSEQTPFIARLHESGRLILPSKVKRARGKTASVTIAVDGEAPVAFEVDPASRGLSVPAAGTAYTLFPGERLELPVQPAGRARSAKLILTELRPGRPSHIVKIRFR